MLLLKHVFTILHIITAAAWFGMGLRLSTQARKALSLEPAAGKALAQDALRTVRLMGPFLALTLVFGLSTFLLGGGFSAYGPAFHTSLLLLVILLGIHYAMVQPASKGLAGALEGAAAASADGEAHRKKLAMGTGIGHLLWLLILVLMFSIKLQAALS